MVKTQSKLAKFVVAASFLGFVSTAIGGNALAQQATAAASPAEHSTTNWLVTYPVGYSDSLIMGAVGFLFQLQSLETLAQPIRVKLRDRL